MATDHTFTGQVEDRSTGLRFYNARYQDPVLGRFISPDTIVPNPGNGQDYYRYAYVGNNPINFNDPTGHCRSSQVGDPRFPQCDGVTQTEYGVERLSGCQESAGYDVACRVSVDWQTQGYLGITKNLINDAGAQVHLLPQCNPIGNFVTSSGICGGMDHQAVLESLVQGLLVAAAATGAAALCPATAGATCVVLAGAGAGAGAQIGTGYALDCAHGDCARPSSGEIAGDAFEGAVTGAAAGYLAPLTATASGSTRSAAGLFSVGKDALQTGATFGQAAQIVRATVVATAGTRVIILVVKQASGQLQELVVPFE